MIKEQVKSLWKLCFDDSEAFIELYFRLRYNNEVNLAIQSGEEVIAALQMLPYPMTFCNKIVPTSYISGACTHPDYRAKGVMRELLSQSFARMLRNGVLFSTLIPAEPWLFGYYAKTGYTPAFRISHKVFSLSELTIDQLSYDLNAFSSVRLVTGYFSRKLSLHPASIIPVKRVKNNNIFFIFMYQIRVYNVIFIPNETVRNAG